MLAGGQAGCRTIQDSLREDTRVNPSPDPQTQELSPKIPVQPSPHLHPIICAVGGTGQGQRENKTQMPG